jgi:hypothetical protein
MSNYATLTSSYTCANVVGELKSIGIQTPTANIEKYSTMADVQQCLATCVQENQGNSQNESCKYCIE